MLSFTAEKMEQAFQPSTNNAVNMNTSLASVQIRIRDPVLFGPLDLGSGLEKKIRIRDEYPRSFFSELRNSFLG
jgi:hypothetical protein